jgi:amino acid permease
MTFRTFFLLTFLLSLLLCFTFTFSPQKIEEAILFLFQKSRELNHAFVGLVSLIVATFSYIGLVLSHYYAIKNEKTRKIKKTAERINLKKIQEELRAMGQ